MNEILLMRKRVDLANSKVLYDRPFTVESLAADWQIRSAEWWIDGGWLTGRNPGNFPGMVTSRANFFGNVAIEFEARTVAPSTHDINCMWNGSWDEEKDQRGVAYVAGLEGWWDGKVGFEKSPEYKLNAANPIFDFEPGRIYRILAGSIDGHVFIFVNERLVLEVTDPEPIDTNRFGMIGFESYCSMIQIRKLVVRQLTWEMRAQTYEPEF